MLLHPRELPGGDREHPSAWAKARRALGKYYGFSKMSSRLIRTPPTPPPPHPHAVVCVTPWLWGQPSPRACARQHPSCTDADVAGGVPGGSHHRRAAGAASAGESPLRGEEHSRRRNSAPAFAGIFCRHPVANLLHRQQPRGSPSAAVALGDHARGRGSPSLRAAPPCLLEM